ncbi:hypothetical protein [Dialister succinatiphilus]|uniref:hypothetical protein n=1 Tax=Dialister succinatiphilus TaxID=487173 RepID=UPI003F801DA0
MISKYQMQPQVDIGLQGAAVLKDFKKHLEETGAKAETLEKVDKAIKYCEDCAEASQIIILALDWKSGLDKPAEKAEETAEEKPAKKEAPKRKRAAKKKEEPKPEPAPTLFDAPKEEPKEEPKAEEPAADDSLDDLF